MKRKEDKRRGSRKVRKEVSQRFAKFRKKKKAYDQQIGHSVLISRY